MDSTKINKQSTRRGWATIPALLMLTVIASVTAGIAGVSWSNVRSAQSMTAIAKAQSAAESGLTFASQRLLSEVNRYIIDQGEIDVDLAERLWKGTWTAADGFISVQPPSDYVMGAPSGNGIVHKLFDVYDQIDNHSVELEVDDALLPLLRNNDFRLELKPVEMDDDATFRIAYELIEGDTAVVITSEGESEGISRTISMEFDLDKRIDYAVVAMSRVMLGKNVIVDGPLAMRYGINAGELNPQFGTPLVMRNDFYGIDPGVLNGQISAYQALVLANDVDGDNKLRPSHPTEGSGLGGALFDYDGDQYVTEMDLFLSRFDSDGNIGVVYDAAQAAAAGHNGLVQEFGADLQLAALIDTAKADRNGDGVIDSTDTELGYNDGIINALDHYAKVDGHIGFAVDVADWEAQTGDQWQSDVSGAINSSLGESSSQFGLPESELSELTPSMFANSTSWFEGASLAGDPFDDPAGGQVQQNIATGGKHSPAHTQPWEGVPYESEGAYDWYQRQTFKNMKFRDVRIPKGTNALFENCTFVGVTWIETHEDTTDPNWNFVGAVAPDGAGGYKHQFTGTSATSGSDTFYDTRDESNNIRFHDCTFLGSVAGDVPSEFTHWRNKVQVTGESRFYIDPEDLDLAEQPDAAQLIASLNSIDPADREQMERSTIMLPGWSVEIGAFNNDETVGVKLNGTIVSGLLDLRGAIDVNGSILSTYRPVEGVGPLFYGGEADAFNTTMGYFGPEDGDGEGVNDAAKPFHGYGRVSITSNPDMPMPDGVPWPITIVADGASYQEGS